MSEKNVMILFQTGGGMAGARKAKSNVICYVFIAKSPHWQHEPAPKNLQLLLKEMKKTMKNKNMF